MLITIGILAIAATLVVPLFSDDTQLRATAAAKILASDIEMAQVMSISFPNDPMVVKFNSAKRTYWIAYAADSDTPIVRSGTDEPYLVEFEKGRASSASGVSITLDNMTSDMLGFDNSGALTDFKTTPHIQLGDGARAITLTIAPMTGTISETNGTIADAKKS